MKKGIIIYIVGDKPMFKTTDPGEEIKRMKLEADKIEIVSHYYGHHDVHDAWWSLVANGMQHILFTIAEMNPYGGLSLKSPMLRLCG
jgi:hypothetical protein